MNRYLFGLDLGRVRDPSALCGIERIRPEYKREPMRYMVALFKTFSDAQPGELSLCPLRNVDFYERLGWYVCQILSSTTKPTMDMPFHRNSAISIDGSGPGRSATIQMLRSCRMEDLCYVLPLSIRSGTELASHKSSGGFHAVTRHELLTKARCAIDASRIEFVKGLPLRQEFDKQLSLVDFDPHANDAPEGSKGGPIVHDDLVMAFAMAIYLGDHIGISDERCGAVDVRYV